MREQLARSLKMLRTIFHLNRPAAVSCFVRAQSTEGPVVDPKPFKDIPKIPSLPLIGSLWAYLPVIGKYNFRKFHLAMKMKHQEYGNICREDMGIFNKFVFIFDPADFETVIRSDGKFPEKQKFKSLMSAVEDEKELFNHPGLFNSHGEEWWALRSKAQPHMMKPRTIINYLPALDEVSKEFVQLMTYLRDPTSLEIKGFRDEIIKFSLESLGYIALDARLGCLSRNAPLDSDLKIAVESVGKLVDMIITLDYQSVIWRFFPTPLYRKFRKTFRESTWVFQKYLRKTQARLESSNKEKSDMTILERLMAENMHPKRLAVIINDLFMVGTETTSNAIGFFFFHMCKYPEQQEKVFQEIKRLIPNKDSAITEQVLNEARYLKACFKESMRLAPVSDGVTRILKKDVVLSGYEVPAGTQLMVYWMVASYSEKYFKEPEKFRPERWLRETEESKSRNPLAFLPFGFGPRLCIGRRIAELELYILAMRVLRRYRLEHHYEDIDMCFQGLNTPDKPLRFQFHDRV